MRPINQIFRTGIISLGTILLLTISVFGQITPNLSISKEEDGIHLTWTAPEGQSRWAVLRSNDPRMHNADTLAITGTPAWIDLNGNFNPAGNWFYKVIPWNPGVIPHNPEMIEDFETGDVDLSSYPGEDQEPTTAQVQAGGPADSDYCLHMFGNTWKVQDVDPIDLEATTVWAVDLYCAEIGEMHMIGLGDGDDVMFYTIWGEDATNTDPWINTYQGWFPDDEWTTIYLPVGEDWHGRFGQHGVIDELYYVNDNDNIWPVGDWYIDNLRDVSNSMGLRPEVHFQWSWGQPVGQDSVEVHFQNMSRDRDSRNLDFFWSFGDGETSQEEHPSHIYPRGGRWPVTLRAIDNEHNWQVHYESVVDSPLTLQSDFTISCAGDIIHHGAYDGMIAQYGIDYLFENIEPYISAADLALCNYENPVTDATEHHPTKSIYFKGRQEDAIGLANAGFDYASLANNHIIDYMVEGMHDTQNTLDEIGVLWGGAGDNDIQARMPTYLSYGGKSIAVISLCNRTGHYNNFQPFLDSGRNRPGFALWNRTAIEATIPPATQQADIVMAFVHCGSEYSRYPMDGDKDGVYFVDEVAEDDSLVVFELHPDSGEVALRHYAIDQGADLVICHHPHVIQGVEIYSGKLIAHSLGNFLFSMSPNETMPSMIIEIHVGQDSVDAAIVRPAWLEGSRPFVVSGGFAAAINDYLSYYSKLLNTHLVRIPGEDVSHVMWDTTYARAGATTQAAFPLEYVNDADYRSRPFLCEGSGGHISRIEASGVGGDRQIRYGRDIILWANMEDEGAQPWYFDSQYEYYSTEQAHEGSRSIKLNIPDNAGDDTYYVSFERRVRYNRYETRDLSFLGWIYTNNAYNAYFQVRRYENRTEGESTSTIPSLFNGDNGWTPVHADFDDPIKYYVDIRLGMERPVNGWAEAWFDEVAFIEWEQWEAIDFNSGVDVPFPSGFRYAQVRSTVEGQADVEWTREWPEQLNLWNGVVDQNMIRTIR